MEGNSDAERIGVELQNLLKIPPIRKGNSNNVNATNSGPFSILEQLGQGKVTEGSKREKVEGGVSVGNNSDSGRNNSDSGRNNSDSGRNNSDSGRNNSDSGRNKSEQSSLPRGHHHHQHHHHHQNNNSNFSRNQQSGREVNESFDSYKSKKSSSMGMKENKSGGSYEDATLRNTLGRPDCPRDFQQEADALLDCANKERNGGQTSSGVKALLARHFVDLLSKRSPKFPKAKYFCSHCNYHMDTIYACVTHVMGIRHTTFELMKKLEYTLVHIPDPSADHCGSLGRFLVGILSEYGITDAEMERRRNYINRLNEELKAANIACSLSLYGSSVTSLGFKDSDINVNVTVNETNDSSGPKSAAAVAAENSEMLQKLFLFFQHHPGSTEVKKLVTSKSAKIHMRECENFCEVILSMNNNAGVETARLFSEYVKLFPLVRLLTIGLRVWAKYCEIDNQDKGCLPPHSYAIMVINYLQRKDLLPNLHLMHESRNANLAEGERRSFAAAEEAPSYWKNYTIPNLGYHWLKMLRFYAVEFNYKESVISISHFNVVRAEKYWNRKISIEDPVIPKSNLSRSMSNNRMCDYILERLKFTYLYFGIPRTLRGPMYDGIVSSEDSTSCRIHVYHKVLKGGGNSSMPPPRRLEKLSNSKWDPVSLTEEVKKVKFKGKVEFPKPHLASVKFRIHQYIDNDHKERTGIHVDDVAAIDDIFPEWLYDYKFDTQVLQNGLKPPIVCKSCGIEGHFRSDCPDEVLPVLRPVMNATPSSLRLLNDVLMQNYEKETLNSFDVEVRAKIVGELESCLLPIYPDAQLTMFGSTHNGFGVHMSDVDVCLTFRNKSAQKVLKSFSRREIVCACQACQDDFMDEAAGDDETNAIVILRTIVERLKSSGFLQEVVAIPSAKVPIVKFRHKATALEGDISLYNTLAMYNTKLLRTYAELDWRVKVIGCFLKKLTKLCDISDASRGSLSSYGYVLMAIHYFQHTPVPVLPVLQELGRDTLEPIIVDGCDVQYFKDLQNLKYVWPYYGKNRQSVSELWLGFLNYYTETFNFEEHVVTISQYNTLNRVYKFWLTDALAIEDPFDRTHNLGAGLSRRMSIHILKTFHHLRQVFHATYDAAMLKKQKDWLSYFMDPKLLQNGNPPLDRQCRICHKIGHIARNCTYNSEKKEVGGGANGNSHTPTLREVIEQVSSGLNERPKSQSNVVVATNVDGPIALAPHPQVPMQQPVHVAHSSQHLPTAPNNNSTQQDQTFPRFFGENSNPNAEDDAIYRMITGEGARETPGVEFMLQEQGATPPAEGFNAEQVKFGNHMDAMAMNHAGVCVYPDPAMLSAAYAAAAYNGMPANFADPGVRLRAGYEPGGGNPGVTFMGHPAFPHMQFMGAPGMGMHHPAAAPPPPGFAPLPNVPIVSHPTYIHPHVIPSHPFPVNLYPISVHRAPAPPQHDGGGHPGPHHLHPFPAVFSTNVGPPPPYGMQQQHPRSESASSIPNGDSSGNNGEQNHGAPIVINGYGAGGGDGDRVCLPPTMTSMSPIMTSYAYPVPAAAPAPTHMAQYPRVNDN